VHWSCPPERLDDLAAAVVESLSSSDGVTRRLAAEALAASHPDAWEGAVHLLHGHDEVAITTLESFVRSGRRHLIEVAEAHLAQLLEEGLRAAREAARYRRLARATAAASEEPQLAILRLALENFQLHVVEMCLAALRAIHRKRDFSTVERGLRSADAAARSEALETLLNLGPAWLVEPLVSLLETDSFESSTLLLSASEVHLIEQSPDAWMDAAAAGRLVSGESVKNLVALRAVPIFSRLSLPELAFVDRLMVTRRYRHGDGIFRIGDQATELYVIRDGGVRIHRDVPGQKVTLARLGPGEFLGETTLLNDERWTVAAEALTECTLRILTAERLEEVVARYPEVLLEFVRRLGGRAPAPAPSAVG
jgi:hypothetical protein